jgi:hypothetical protein
MKVFWHPQPDREGERAGVAAKLADTRLSSRLGLSSGYRKKAGKDSVNSAMGFGRGLARLGISQVLGTVNPARS